MAPRIRTRERAMSLALCIASTVATVSGAHAAPPEIRIHRDNAVPRCVTPERLMTFLRARNPHLDRRFAGIAKWYRQHGETWRVRWDYAFFQMAIETNYLSYRRPDGRWGDVNPRQNNFAGIGTTGGGVPGDSFPDVSTGVLGQIQHLVAYSGEPLAAPVAPRTQLKQADIVAASRKLGRPVRFSDLARRWAVDPRYGHSIEYVAETFRREHCSAPEGVRGHDARRETLPWRRSSLGGPRAVPAQWEATVVARSSEPAAPRESEAATPAALAPAPKPTARSRQVVRTVWRRGDPPTTVAALVYGTPEPESTKVAPTASAVPNPSLAVQAVAPVSAGPARGAATDDNSDPNAAIDATSRSSLLTSLSAMAGSLQMSTKMSAQMSTKMSTKMSAQIPIVAPAPRLVARAQR